VSRRLWTKRRTLAASSSGVPSGTSKRASSESAIRAACSVAAVEIAAAVAGPTLLEAAGVAFDWEPVARETAAE
jgi:hypothetical protein